MAPLPARLLGLRRRQLFALYVLGGGLGIVLAVSIFTMQIARRVESQTRVASWLLSSIVSRALGQGEHGGLADVMHAVNQLEVPFILTDNSGRPLQWNEAVIGVTMPASLSDLQQIDPAAPAAPEIQRILELVRLFDADNEPFAIVDPHSGRRLGTLHYGPSRLSRQLRWMPHLELLVLAAFFMLIVWALRMKQESDQQRLLAGMAKETAHQLGTPLTALLGWLALLRERHGDEDEMVRELAQDIGRLNKVSERFSQIGSRPRLEDTELAGLVAGTIAYFQRRLPHLGGRVDLRQEGAARHRVRFNRELMEWVLENLIKNGIDALKDGKGTISIRIEDAPGGGVALRVSDTGTGIPAGQMNKIFEPGFTTKQRGWGMGLALVRRIVTQYHGGRIQVAATGPQGTTFLITLPGEENRRGV